MSGFRKAKAEQAALKVAVYGPPGSGKTLTTLLMAEGLAKREGKRIAYVDTERGTDFYCKTVPERSIHPAAFDFDALYTRSIIEVLNELKKLDPAIYGVVGIDSMTHIWEAAKAAYVGKQTKIGTIPFQAWTQIKKPYKDIMNFLLSTPMHVFILGRQGTDYATDEETDELKAVGLKMKAEGETAYEPHILLRMEAIKPKKANAQATIVAYAEKDRTGVLSGRSFANPTFETICGPLLGLLGSTQAQIKSSEEIASDDAEAIERAERALVMESEELMRTFAARIELAESAAALKKIGDGITPAIKAKMLPGDLAAVREKYQRRMSTMLPTKEDPSTYWHRQDAPHDSETGEVASDKQAVAKAVMDHRNPIIGLNPASLPPEARDAAHSASSEPAAEHRQQEDAGARNPSDAPASDQLLDAGRAAATNGSAAIEKWWKRLSTSDAEHIAPHIDSLRETARYADTKAAP